MVGRTTHVVLITVFFIKSNKTLSINISNTPLPPWGPRALRSLASGMRVWAWRWLCIPTQECHQWSSEHPQASQSSEVKL